MKAVLTEDGMFKCPFCSKKFPVCAALGGHVSKSHPGRSQTYNHKKRVREERFLDRELHNFAKELYTENERRNNPGIGHKPIMINRNGLKELKKKIVQEFPRFESLRGKFDLIEKKTT